MNEFYNYVVHIGIISSGLWIEIRKFSYRSLSLSYELTFLYRIFGVNTQFKNFINKVIAGLYFKKNECMKSRSLMRISEKLTNFLVNIQLLN